MFDDSIRIYEPSSVSTVFVFNSTLDTAAIEANASPRKPRVLILNRSSDTWIFEVAWRSIITYTLSISNNGSITATNVLISDTLSMGLTLAGPATLDPPQSAAILATSLGPADTGHES